MSTTLTLIATSAFVFGTIITWLYRKLYSEKHMVLASEYAFLLQKNNELSKEKAVIDERLSTLKGEKSELDATIAQLQKDVRDNIEINAKLQAVNEEGEKRKWELEEEVRAHKEALKERTEDLTRANNELVELTAKFQYQQQSLEQQKKDLEEMAGKLKKDFELLANSILEEKTQKFSQLNSEKLTDILTPLRQNLVEFKTKVEEAYDKEAKERFSLGEKIKDLVESSNKVSEEAHNLSCALKADVKMQGNWGEMILERVLEMSGMVKDREYFLQEYIRDADGHTVKNEEGNRLQPDATIHYPGKRQLVVDAKVSLVAYERYCRTTDSEHQEAELQSHLKSVRNHVDGLSKKNYHKYLDSLEWVVMFVPIESAYLLSIQHDAQLWQYAYEKKIILACPSNLLAILKIACDLWKREYQTQNVLAIAEKAGKLYDKFVGFVKDMQDLGISLSKAQSSYDEAFSKLKTGPGNLVRKAEEMRKLEIKASKQLPLKVVEDAMDDTTGLIDGQPQPNLFITKDVEGVTIPQ